MCSDKIYLLPVVLAHPRIVYRIMGLPCHHGNLPGPGFDCYLPSWDSVSLMESEYCTIIIGDGFISSCHRKPSGSFEFTLVHFGCEPSAVLFSPRLLSSTSVSFQFSQSTLFLERDFFEIGTLSLE